MALGAPAPSVTSGRWWLLAELVIVIVLAFGSPISYSIAVLFGAQQPDASQFGSDLLRDWQGIVQDAVIIALVVILLRRDGLVRAVLGRRTVGAVILIGIGLFSLQWVVCGMVYKTLIRCGLPHDPTAYASATAFTTSPLGVTTVLATLLNPVVEELIVRGYAMDRLRAIGLGAVATIAISVAVQTSYHFYQGVAPALAVGSMFLISAVYYTVTRDLLSVILAHGINNAFDLLPT